MYVCIKGNCSIRFNNLVLKSYIQKSKELTEQDKKIIARSVIKNQYNKFTNKSIGTFVDIKQISNIRLSSSAEDYNSTVLTADVQLYFYKISVRDIVDFSIASVSPSGVQGFIGGYLVIVPSDHLSLTTPVFNAALNCFQVNDKKFKPLDVLRIRVTSVSNPSGPGHSSYKIIGSCRNTGAGKISTKL